MKSALIGLILTVSLSSFANTVKSVYKNNSNLPNRLKHQVLNLVKSRCSKVVSTNSLSEMTTTVYNYDSATDYETVFESTFYVNGNKQTQKIVVMSTIESNYHDGVSYTFAEIADNTFGCKSRPAPSID